MTSALPILFSGLIAFVDAGSDGLTSAYALASDMHKTVLIFEASDITGSYPEGTMCSRDGNWWKCTIEKNVDLELGPEFPPFRNHTGAKPGNVRPVTESGASNSAWLLRMANVDPSRRRAKKFEIISGSVRLQMKFAWKTAEVCHLDQEEDEDKPGYFNIFPMRVFEYLSDSSGHTQAVAEAAMFMVEFKGNPSITLKQRNAGDGVKFRLECLSGKCSGLYISNDSSTDYKDDLARHMDDYYNVAEDSNEEKRFLIREREAVPLTVKGQLNKCPNYYPILRARKALTYKDPAAGAETRVICPMVMFDKP